VFDFDGLRTLASISVLSRSCHGAPRKPHAVEKARVGTRVSGSRGFQFAG